MSPRTPTTPSPDAALRASYRAHLDVMSSRLEAALEGTELDGLVILAGDLQTAPRDDVPYPFRVEPHFAAWVPLNRLPGAALILAPGKRPMLLYPQPDDYWHAPPRDPEGFWVDSFDIRTIKTTATQSAELAKLGDGFALIGDPGAGAGSLRARFDSRVLARLDFERARKTEYEVACMREASRIAARGHTRVAKAFGNGVSEFELNHLYCAATVQSDDELPYRSIVALNEHGAVLHYQHLDRTPPPAVLSLLIDAGAESSGYAADVTRTWTPRGSPLAPLIDSMETLQQTLCAEARAGVDFVALHERANELLAEVLVEHDLVACTASEAHAAGLTRAFLPHGLGHLIGLQVHDAGGRQISRDGEIKSSPVEHPFLRLTRVLEPGFAVTIEPGLYFIRSLLEQLPRAVHDKVRWRNVEALLPYGGIRIEDDVIVQKTKPVNLTREAFAACNGA